MIKLQNIKLAKLLLTSHPLKTKKGVRFRQFVFAAPDFKYVYFRRGQNIRMVFLVADLDRRQRGGAIRRSSRFLAKREAQYV